MNGVDATIVNRANYLAEISAKGDDLVTTCAGVSEREEDDLRDAVNESVRVSFRYQHWMQIGGDSEAIPGSEFSKLTDARQSNWAGSECAGSADRDEYMNTLTPVTELNDVHRQW